jgi:catechol 2,3-dioxygenase-like lactoylglutathione lyase family enzyme
MSRTGGIDHVDMRVAALGVVERFYDAFAQRLGLTVKRYARVEFGGASWDDGTPENYNAVEYYAEPVSGTRRTFFGVIEEPDAQPSRSRIAFAVAEDELDEWARLLPGIGAREIERGEPSYPAVFFTDPLGTRLEVCARRPSP